MDEKKVTSAPEQSGDRDQALFASIRREKQRKKRRRIIVTVSIVVVLALAIFFGVRAAKKKVREAVGSMKAPTVSEAIVTTGSISTTVSGSGMLTDADTQQIVLPKGVKLEKILVKAGETVKKGDALATVELSSVMGAMSTVQAELNKLDEQLRAATGETVQPYITTGVNGRVKIVYAQKDDDVSACMMEHGALAVLSLDGYMAVDIDAGSLAAGDKVSVTVDEKTYPGTVDKLQSGKATVLLTDNGPAVDAAASVQDADGNTVGSGTLYIHNPLRITGYAGVVSYVNTAENRQVYAGNSLFTLRDTAYSANYESVLKNRREKEEDLMALLGMYSAGAVTAPFDGSVSSIDYSDKTTSSSDKTDSSAGGGGMVYGGMMNAYTSYGSDGSDSSGDGSSSSGSTAASGETKLLTLSSDTSMKLTVSVDETDILSARMKAMQLAIDGLAPRPDFALIDGNRDHGKFAAVTTPHRCIVGGDAHAASIAAASILAKVSRDRYVIDVLDKQYPEYQFARHKGYGTKLHYEMLDKFGPCAEHRMSFLKKWSAGGRT